MRAIAPVLLVLLPASAGCAGLWGFDDLFVGDAGAPGDSSSQDGPPSQDAGDATQPPTAWHDVTNPSFWSTFDLTSLTANAQGFFGGAFDGRYVYFVPSTHTLASRYDTRANFSSSGSWETFDTAVLHAATVGYRGG